MLMNILLVALLGSFLNRVRGGWLTTTVWKLNIANYGDETFYKSFGKVLNDVVYAILFTCFILGKFQANIFFILYLSMLLGRSPGWGVYIGGIINKVVRKEEEIEWIDELILNKTNYPALRNSLALSLRGFMWSSSLLFGITLAATYESVILPSKFMYIMPLGLTMGFIYWLACIISEKTSMGRGWGWSLGEYMFGFILWGGAAYFIS